jgi:branched-chain amino acid transport system substrate-binding protein
MEIGQTLNQRYTLTTRLGKGAMGIVYRATDLQTGQDVAVKVIARELALDDDTLERFRREGEALRQLRHPNIVGFIDMLTLEEQHVIIMEYVPGGSLHALLREGPLPLERTRRMTLELCDALTRAHHLNIIHRDLKPENVLLAADGTPKLTDFGVARLISEGTRLTSTGAQVGTPFYMSPEAWEGKPLDAQTDIWSLGIMLYEMLSGQVPFSGDTIVAVMNKVLNAPLPELTDLRPDVPPGLAEIVRRMLERDKADRYHSMRELAADLERGEPLTLVADKLRSGAAKPTQARARPQKTAVAQAQRQGLSPWLAVGLGAVALLLLAGAGLGLGGWWLATHPAITHTPFVTQLSSAPTAAALMPTPAPTRLPVYVTQGTRGAAPSQAATAAANPALKIGVLVPLSGPNAAYGASARDGAQMAVDEWNAQGGLLGAAISAILADGQCRADPAVAAAQRLFDQDGVRYLIGEVCSVASLPVSAIAESKGVVQISPASSSPKVTLNDDGSTKAYVFRACFTDPFQGTVMANFALGLRLQRAYVIWDQSSDYSRGLADNFITAFESAGGTIGGKEAYAPETKDFSAILGRVAAKSTQVLFVPDLSQRVNLIAQQAQAQKLTAVLMGGDGWEGSDLDLSALDGGYYSTGYSELAPQAGASAWAARYRARYNRAPDAMAALAYDAANLLFIAIRRAGADDPAKVKDSLASLQSEGVTGQISFDAQHNPLKSAVILHIKDGQRVYASTVQVIP